MSFFLLLLMDEGLSFFLFQGHILFLLRLSLSTKGICSVRIGLFAFHLPLLWFFFLFFWLWKLRMVLITLMVRMLIMLALSWKQLQWAWLRLFARQWSVNQRTKIDGTRVACINERFKPSPTQ